MFRVGLCLSLLFGCGTGPDGPGAVPAIEPSPDPLEQCEQRSVWSISPDRDDAHPTAQAALDAYLAADPSREPLEAELIERSESRVQWLLRTPEGAVRGRVSAERLDERGRWHVTGGTDCH